MRRLLVSAGVFSLLLVTAAPTMATPPDESGRVVRIELPFGVAYEDAADGLVALGGPPAELGCLGEGFEDVPHQGVVMPNGVVNLLVKDVDQAFYIYEASSINEVCESVYAGNIPEPILTGSARVVATDNDAFGAGRNTNSWGSSTNGTVYDAEGNPWHFNASIRLQFSEKRGFRIVHESINLVNLGG